MNYTETLDYLFSRLPMFQRTGPIAYKNSLDNTLKLDNLYGNPHTSFKSIHVAGTNGKGSVSHMLAAIFQEAGYKTGLYTSPHLKDFRERIKINGDMISEEEVIEWVRKYSTNNKVWKIEPSFFELTVAMAFDYFAKEKVDIAIIEVGLGGRLDSTNIISPELSIITNIGLDHTALLGNTIEKIAIEKAGIIKQQIPVIIGTTQKETKGIFKEIAKKLKSDIYFADKEYKIPFAMNTVDGKQIMAVEKDNKPIFIDLKLDLAGFYQQKNIPAVLKAVELMQNKSWKISTDNIYNALSTTSKLTGILGRWQVIGNNPLIICDTGHNEDGMKQVLTQISQTPHKNLHFIFGMVSDKEPKIILKLLPENACYYFTKAAIPRALDEVKLAELAKKEGLTGNSYSSVKMALTDAKLNAEKEDLIFIGGSTFIVAEIL